MVKNSYCILLVLLGSIIYSCRNAEGPVPVNDAPSVKQEQFPWTGMDMVEILDSINRNSVPEENYHMNKARAQKLEKQLETTTDAKQRVQLYYDLATEYLNGGRTTNAIELINNVLASSGGSAQKITSGSKPWFDLLAISYLRKGEQENCQNNHNSHSCFVPLQGPGVYQEKIWSEQAIQLYERILGTFPEDHQSKWLLNVATMSVGRYPEGIAREHLIELPKGTLVPVMQERAMAFGIMRMGLSGGAIMDDFNGDGWKDIFCTSYWLYDNVKLYLNDEGKAFKDVTERSGLKGITSGLNCVQVDYDNDGDLDLFVLRGAWLKKGGAHPNSLIRNNGDGTFTDVTIESGILSFHPTQTATWSDFDLDGDLDVFIGNESTTGSVHPCEFFLNNGDGTFTERAKQVGLHLNGWMKGSNAGDINNDGRPDLYVSNIEGANYLFLNEATDAGFRMVDISEMAAVQAPRYSFPCWFFDVDNDGFEDLFVSGYDISHLGDVAGQAAREYLGLPTQAEKMRLYLNNQDGTFKEASSEYGLDKVAFTMGSNFGDINNDGFPDIYLGTGAPDFKAIVPNRMFLNTNGAGFVEVTHETRTGNVQKGHGVAFGDMDNDGDQDIYCTMGGAFQGDTYPDLLLLSEYDAGNSWISVDLVGTTANRFGVGARLKFLVEEVSGAEHVVRHTVGSGGSFGANSLTAEVGLGKCKIIKELEIKWPDRAGSTQTFRNILPVQRIRITQDTDTPEVL